MSVHNLRKYKESIALLPDIEIMLKILTLTEKSLIHYASYIPAAKVMFTIKDQKRVLESYQTELATIKNSKGLKVEV